MPGWLHIFMNGLLAVRTCGYLGSLLVKVYLGRGTKETSGDQAVWEHNCERPWRLGLQTDFTGGGCLHMQELVRVVLEPGPNHWLQESQKSSAAKGGHSPNTGFGPSTWFNLYLDLGCSELRYNKHSVSPLGGGQRVKLAPRWWVAKKHLQVTPTSSETWTTRCFLRTSLCCHS